MSTLTVLAQGIKPVWAERASAVMAARPRLVVQATRMLGGHRLDPTRQAELNIAVMQLVGSGVEFQWQEGEPVLWADLRVACRAAIASANAYSEKLKRLGRLLVEARLLEFTASPDPRVQAVWEQVEHAEMADLTKRPEIITGLQGQIDALHVLLHQAPEGRQRRRRVSRDFVGHWKALYVAEAGKLFVSCRGEGFATTEGGPFHQFVGVVFELLTGVAPEEEGVGLKKYVEHVVPRIKQLTELQELVAAADGDERFDEVVNECNETIGRLERELIRGPTE